MKKYEVMYIIRPTVDAEGVKKVIEDIKGIFTNRASQVLALKEIGLKDLAYEIDGCRKGYYVWMEVEANNEAVAEYRRVIRITETVIRDIIVSEEE